MTRLNKIRTCLFYILLIFLAGPVFSEELYYPDYTAADQSLTNGYTVKTICNSIGTTKKATIILRHDSGETNTDYVFANDLDLSNYSNINFVFENGARFFLSDGNTIIFSTTNITATPDQHIFVTESGTNHIAGIRCCFEKII
jgi:hypothetical protein